MPVPERNVALFNLNPGEVRHEFLISCLTLMAQEPRLAGIYPRICGGNLGIHRNEAVEFFLNDLSPTNKWLFFLDSDLQIANDTIEKLIRYADPETAPIVSGLYVNVAPDATAVPMLYRWRDGHFDHLTNEEMDGEEVVDVDGTGAGCLMIHRSALEKMVEKYGYPMPCFANDIYHGVVQGEDFSFCIRVKDCGLPPIKGVLNVETTHIKSHGLARAHLYAKKPEMVECL